MRSISGVAAALAALALSACGGSELSLEAQVANAATATRKTHTMRVAMTTTMPIPEAGIVTLSGSGAVDNRTSRARMTMKIPPVDGQDFGEITVVMDRLDLYMRIDVLQRLGGPGELKPWVKIDLQKLGKQEGFDFAALVQAGQNDPGQTLDYLRGAGSVEEVGEDTVRGIKTTHYRANVDLERAADQLSGRGAARARATIRRTVRTIGQKTMQMDVWIDSQSLVRRLRWSQPIPAAEDGAKQAVTTTLEMYDFDSDVQIGIPPQKDIMTIEQWLKISGGP